MVPAQVTCAAEDPIVNVSVSVEPVKDPVAIFPENVVATPVAAATVTVLS
jgi:hypothetical protein